MTQVTCHTYPGGSQDPLSAMLPLRNPAAVLTWTLGSELVGHIQQRQKCHQTVVTIGLNEVMPRDGCRVDVVLPEWPDEGLGWTGYRCSLLVSQRQLVP